MHHIVSGCQEEVESGVVNGDVLPLGKKKNNQAVPIMTRGAGNGFEFSILFVTDATVDL